MRAGRDRARRYPCRGARSKTGHRWERRRQFGLEQPGTALQQRRLLSLGGLRSGLDLTKRTRRDRGSAPYTDRTSARPRVQAGPRRTQLSGVLHYVRHAKERVSQQILDAPACFKRIVIDVNISLPGAGFSGSGFDPYTSRAVLNSPGDIRVQTDRLLNHLDWREPVTGRKLQVGERGVGKVSPCAPDSHYAKCEQSNKHYDDTILCLVQVISPANSVGPTTLGQKYC